MNLVFFLEEPSAKEMLKGLLSRLLPDNIHPHYIVFEGKQDLEKQLVRRLRGWISPRSYFVVLRDQDSGDCTVIKENLLQKCQEAEKPETMVRIACRELESWYFGNLSAVEIALEIQGLVKYHKKKKYRIPDEIGSPSDELAKLTLGRYQKVSGSRAIGRHLSLDDNHSKSYQAFIRGLKRLLSTNQTPHHILNTP